MAESKKNSKLGAILLGPFLVFAGVYVLWENEGRFNFYKAARRAPVVSNVNDANGQETFAFTSTLETEMPIKGSYLEGFTGYYKVTRSAEIYCWDRDEDSDGDVTWSKEWMSSVDNNSRNSGIKKTLEDAYLYPEKYDLGDLVVATDDIHLVDSSKEITPNNLVMTEQAKQAQLRATREVLFKGKGSPGNPQLGDERLTYRGVPNAPTASYFGAIKGDTAGGKQFEIKKSFISGIIQNDGVLHHIVNGDRDEALSSIKGYFAKVMWFTRLGGTVAIVIGFWITLGSFLGLLYGVPLIGKLIEWGAFLISLVLGLMLALTVIVASYIFHHPIFVGLPLVAVIVGIYFLRRRSAKTKTNVQNALHEYQSNHLQEFKDDHLDDGFDIDVDQPGWNSQFAEHTFQKLAAVAALNGFSGKEIKFLKNWGESNGISSSRVEEMIEAASSGPNKVKVDNRNDMILLVCVALADGMLSSRELAALKALAKRMGMTTQELDEMIAGVESGELRPA